MFFLLATALAGSSVSIQDRHDAHYFAETRRAEESAQWFRQRFEATNDVWLLVDYLSILPQLRDLRHEGLLASVETWGAAHPDAPLGVAKVYARLAGQIGPNWWSTATPLHMAEAGPWCDEARRWLSDEQEDPQAAYRYASTRWQVARVCRGDVESAEAQAKDRSEGGGLVAQAYFALQDGVEPDDLPILDALIEHAPIELSKVAFIFGKQATGSALQKARARVLVAAHALAKHERPAEIWAAKKIFHRARETQATIVALQRLQHLDPDNRQVPVELKREHAPKVAQTAAPEPSTVLDPAARLKALQNTSPPRGRRARFTYWNSWVEAAEAVGDGAALVKGARHARDAKALARGALLTGTKLRRAERWLGSEIRNERVPFILDYFDEADRQDWRRSWAELHGLRGAVRQRRNRTDRAERDLRVAMALTKPDPEWAIRLGLVLGEAHPFALSLVAHGLAAKPELTHDLEEAAWSSVDAAIEQRQLWAVGGAVPLVEGHRPKAEASPVGNPQFDALSFTIGDTSTTLAELEGPVVIDAWATWCPPCVASLPHLDALARKHEGRFTMVALSVEEDRQAAARYLAERGDVAFEAAYAGPQGMVDLGVTGIPAVFVLDRNHRLVDQITGYAPGDERLERAIQRALLR
ncbi:MAG: TlpA disulfide reductase family protein [Myxococcota bacterium]